MGWGRHAVGVVTRAGRAAPVTACRCTGLTVERLSALFLLKHKLFERFLSRPQLLLPLGLWCRRGASGFTNWLSSFDECPFAPLQTGAVCPMTLKWLMLPANVQGKARGAFPVGRGAPHGIWLSTRGILSFWGAALCATPCFRVLTLGTVYFPWFATRSHLHQQSRRVLAGFVFLLSRCKRPHSRTKGRVCAGPERWSRGVRASSRVPEATFRGADFLAPLSPAVWQTW